MERSGGGIWIERRVRKGGREREGERYVRVGAVVLGGRERQRRQGCSEGEARKRSESGEKGSEGGERGT